MKPEKNLYLIPARAGSKGIPGKNIKLLAGKPLIGYAIEAALENTSAENICVSTDSQHYADIAESFGIKVPFLRPADISADNTSSRDVMLHALDFYSSHGSCYDRIVLLQPTSPLRTARHISEAVALYDKLKAEKLPVDMVVSVKPAATNPYYTAFETDENGTLHISKGDGLYTRRQDAPEVWEYNGAVYVIDADSLRREEMGRFRHRYPYIMKSIDSIDLDTPVDWMIAEHILAEKNKTRS